MHLRRTERTYGQMDRWTCRSVSSRAVSPAASVAPCSPPPAPAPPSLAPQLHPQPPASVPSPQRPGARHSSQSFLQCHRHPLRRIDRSRLRGHLRSHALSTHIFHSVAAIAAFACDTSACAAPPFVEPRRPPAKTTALRRCRPLPCCLLLSPLPHSPPQLCPANLNPALYLQTSRRRNS